MLPSLLECLTVPGTSPCLPGLLLAEPAGTACIIRGFFPFKINPPQLARTPVVLLQQHLPTESPSFSHSSLPAPAPKSVLEKETSPMLRGQLHPSWVTVPSGDPQELPLPPASGSAVMEVQVPEMDKVCPNSGS